jgi:hypothetical protein
MVAALAAVHVLLLPVVARAGQEVFALPALEAVMAARPDDQRERDRAELARETASDAAGRQRLEQQYQRGRLAIDREQWAVALEQFAGLAQAGRPRGDAAMFWRAYALDKMNRPVDALGAVADLLRTFPDSRWLGDARALQLLLRQRTGQSANVEASTDDEDLRLLAIQALQHSAPERAVPLLAKVLAEGGSLRLKERALFVLAQGTSPQARAKLADVARGAANPELQAKAVQYLGMSTRPEDAALLAVLYSTARDLDVKRQVLRAFMLSGDRQRVVMAATTEKAPELRQEAVRQLGMMGARDELWELYQKESDVAVKRSLLGALSTSGAAARLVEVVNSERNLDLRLAAVRQLGASGGTNVSGTLLAVYNREAEPRLRRAAIEALFIQGNADALVSLARSETNAGMRHELVQRLSLMNTPAALDFLTELLNK